MIGFFGSSLMMELFINMIPIIIYFTFGLILVWLIILFIFLQRKRAYKLLLAIVWLLSFGAILLLVVKTYAYIPTFIMSVIAGSVLVVWWFVSRFSCFWGYKQRKLPPFWLPLSIRGWSVITAYILLFIFPDPEILVNYSVFVGGVEELIYNPWIIDRKEFIFAGLFFVLLWFSRFTVESVLYYSKVSKERDYNWKRFSLLLLWIVIILGFLTYIKRDVFLSPVYDKIEYQDVLFKKWYQANIATWENIYYRQNQWLLSHTWFLNKINQNSFVVQNYLSQTGLVKTGFIEFWQEFSWAFHQEFSKIALLTSGTYAMINTGATVNEVMWFPEEKLRERTQIINAVAVNLCINNQCKDWFSYRKDRFVFVNKRLESGAGIVWSLISLVSVQKSLSGAQEMIPYLTIDQKNQLKSLLNPYDTWFLYHNMIVQEYFFVRGLVIENSEKFMKEQNISAPKFILDLDYTDYLIQKHFLEALSNPQKQEMIDYENQAIWSYNILGKSILNALLPRVSHIYNRFDILEEQRIRLLNLIKE